MERFRKAVSNTPGPAAYDVVRPLKGKMALLDEAAQSQLHMYSHSRPVVSSAPAAPRRAPQPTKSAEGAVSQGETPGDEGIPPKNINITGGKPTARQGSTGGAKERARSSTNSHDKLQHAGIWFRRKFVPPSIPAGAQIYGYEEDSSSYAWIKCSNQP